MMGKMGIGIGIPYLRGGGFCAEYQAVYNSFTTKPSASVASVQNTMVNGLVSSGRWDTRDVIYVFAAHTNNNGEALINWKNPGTHDAEIVLNGGTMNFVAFEGFSSPDGAYIRTHYIPSTDAANYALNDASCGIYLRTNIAEDKRDIGCEDPSSNRIEITSRWTTDSIYSWINSGGYMTVANADSRGMYISVREGSAVTKLYKNKTNIVSDTDASTSLPSVEVYALCKNGNGTAVDFSTKQASFVQLGSSLNQTGVDNITDRSEEHTSELQSHSFISYAVFCLKKKKKQ